MSSRPPDLIAESRAARELVEFLRASGIEGEDDVRISLESETLLLEAATDALHAIEEDEHKIAGCSTRIDELAVRVRRLKMRVQSRRAALARAIRDAGLPKPVLVLPEATLSVSAGKPSVVIRDEALIPGEFKVPVLDEKTDRKAVAAALERGGHVPGAELSNGSDTLTIRRR